MRCVLGLGNPEACFADSRHNIGFRLVELLAERCGVRLRPRLYARMAIGGLGGRRVILAHPLTCGEDSAAAVRSFFHLFRLGAPDFLIAAADPNLPLGQCDLALHGHLGRYPTLARISDTLGERNLMRLWLGVGPVPSGQEPAAFLMTPFRPEELPLAEVMVARAAMTVEAWVAMDRPSALTAVRQGGGGIAFPPT